ncbi:MAG: hypothetical protein D6754_05395 [Alphaproteobacteria bacterium]|nr:MAG: hypothetical protein D6754_05395 [Alphaproteobacteria bacterium]
MTAAQPPRQRELRLDFFRGLAMFIILLAHTPGNSWTLWIPARFGFSDAAEIFVFCSGFASAIAFGAVFARRGLMMGTGRIVYRIWQVYWAQIGMLLATVLLLFLIDRHALGLQGHTYLHNLPVMPLFERTGEALMGLATLSWVPNYFDILPMYLVILAMVPLVMAIHRFAGKEAVFAAVLILWLTAQFAGYAYQPDAEGWPRAVGAGFAGLNLPSRPWAPEVTWFFNPFGWQIVFFTGFAFGMGWLPKPPVNRRLIIAAATYVVAVIPFAWFRIHGGQYLPDEWLVQDWIADAREWGTFLWWKSWVGGARYLHFLALAYLAWVAVGAGGERLRSGWTAPGRPGPRLQWAAAIIALLTFPYGWVDMIAAWWPALNAAIVHHLTVTAEAIFGTDLLVPGERIGLLQLIHLGALLLLAWAAIGQRARDWLLRDGFLALVPIIRKVGTQSLAVFVFSMPLAQANGWVLDLIGREAWSWALVNLSGFLILIAVAYVVGWFRSQPWRKPASQSGAARRDGLVRMPAE